jgi:membrane associated rhomboid family serine protease
MDENKKNSGASAPQDGAMDLSGYSDAQLQDLRLQMDAARFPRNSENLDAEIARRAASGQGQRFGVRFTVADGLLGWIQARQARQPFYGAGSIAPAQEEVLVGGWQRTWLGTAHQTEIAIAARRVRNAYSDQEWISFDVQRRFWWPRHYMARAADADAAATLARLLPPARSSWFEKQATDIQQFYRLQRAPGRHPRIAPLLVATSLAVYFLQAASTGYWLGFDGGTLLNWGANAGNLTVHGGWWRLVASLFLHLNFVHLMVNMWVLWSVGRLAERSFGNLRFAVIYFTAGIMGGLFSIGWNPAVFSVGASGAIFGILGAFLAYLVHGGTRIPRPVMRAHLIPTILFILLNILSGIGQVGIDNAAHFGGLFTGLLLGWALASPFARRSPHVGLAQTATAIALVIIAAGGLLLQVTGPASRPSPQEQFLETHDWYRAGETRNLLRWQETANQVAAGTIASAVLAQRFEKEIIPFWRDAEPRLRKEIPDVLPETRGVVEAAADFADLRLRWASAIVESAKSGSSERAIELMQKTDVAQARLDWFSIRSQYDHKAFSLAENLAIAHIANIAWFNYRPCTRYPYLDFNPVAPGDLTSDAPARELALACQAQRLFLTRDFKGLEATLETARRHPGDLADGASSYDGLTRGLDILMDYGGLSADAVMARLADWRKTVPGSVNADVAEVQALVSWAYSARGRGYVDSVTAQNQIIFQHRIEIANAALEAMEPRAKDYAAWYAYAIDVNLLEDGKEDERSAIFNRAHDRFADDLSIDSAMLHSLMPRWGGSFEKVENFIIEQAQEKPGGMPPEEKYARLYWIYAGLEGKEADIFKDAHAKPDMVSSGMALAVKRYPKSDYLVNVSGRLACQSGERPEYETFQQALPKRYSASAWAPDFTVESCNKKFGLQR